MSLQRDRFFETQSGEPHHLSIHVESQKSATQRVLTNTENVVQYPGRQVAVSQVLSRALNEISHLITKWEHEDGTKHAITLSSREHARSAKRKHGL